MGEMAARLATVDGVIGVVLGGSRARGEERPDSDWDFGLYYRGAPHLPTLRSMARGLSDSPAEVSGPGEWGRWVDGGAWLTVGGTRVDWILRDVDRVGRVWSHCREGEFEIGIQPGHPLGFWSPCYVGELALGRVLADPSGELTKLQHETARYPEPLRRSLVGSAGEAEFIIGNAAKAALRGDVLLVSLALSRAIGILVQALYAWHRRWCLNEKGALAVAEALPGTPPAFGPTARTLLGAPGTTPDELSATISAAAALVSTTRATLTLPPAPPGPPHSD